MTDHAGRAPPPLLAIVDADEVVGEAPGLQTVVVGYDGDAYADGDLLRQAAGRWVVLVRPYRCDESIDLDALTRRFIRTVGPHAASLSVAHGILRSPADALEIAVPSSDWLRERSASLGRWAPIFLDDVDPVVTGEWLIKGVLPAHGLAVIFGPSEAGKTFAATDMLFHIAEGENWRGNRTARRGVVYVAAEGAEGCKKRLFALRRRKRYPDRRTPFAMISATPDLHASAADAKALADAIEVFAGDFDEPIGVVVFDTFAQSLGGGSDNDIQDIGRVLANAREIERRTGALVLFIHHTGHLEKDRMRGHSSFHAACDAVLGVKVEDPESKLRSITLQKLKDGESGARWSFELEPIEIGLDNDGEPVTTCLVRPRDDVIVGAPRTMRITQVDLDANTVAGIAKRLMISGGTTIVPPAEIRKHLKAGQLVPRDALRDECYSRGFHSDAGEEARRKAFQRAISRLKERGSIDEWEGWLSLIK